MIYTKNLSCLEKIKEEYGHLPLPKIAAFDLDKTVHDIIALYEKLVNETRIYMGKEPWLDEDFRDLHHNGFISNEISFAKMFPGRGQKALEFYYHRFHQMSIPKDAILPGASFLLYRMKHLYNIKLIGVTNSEQHMAKKALRDLGIFNMFDSITGPKGNRKLKPETDLLLIGLNKIGQNPSKNVWFIGDSPSDTICAKDANCTGIRFYSTYDKPIDHNADAYYNCHFQLEKVVGTLLGIYSEKNIV